ncbi:MAG: C40 family peptidase [Lachnospiraceae bacterium]|nr:C40 family peptidase [Lachnospiraceae bacterium]
MASAQTASAAASTGAGSSDIVFFGAGVETAAGGLTATIETDQEAASTEVQTTALPTVATDEAVAAQPDTDDSAVIALAAMNSDPTTDLVADASATDVAVPAEIAAATLQESAPAQEAEQTQQPATTVSGQDVAASSAKEMYQNLVIAKCNDFVNVRKEPNEEAEILGKLYNESVGDFVSEAENGWVEIISGTVRGYVKSDYVVTGDEAVEKAKEVGKRIATVHTTTLYVREEPTTDAPVVGMVGEDDDLTVLEENDGWAKVSIEEGDGYISTEFATLKTEFHKAESKEEEAARLAKEKAEREAAQAAANKKSGKKKKGSGGSGGGSVAAPSGGNGSAVASYALQFVGNPYVYGGSSLTNGTDCSGFTMSVYAAFGVGLPHSSGAQRSCGTDVGGLANAQPGDIVCYSGHVGIYIGNGQIVHASTAKTGIKVSNASYRSVLSVRRIL